MKQFFSKIASACRCLLTLPMFQPSAMAHTIIPAMSPSRPILPWSLTALVSRPQLHRLTAVPPPARLSAEWASPSMLPKVGFDHWHSNSLLASPQNQLCIYPPYQRPRFRLRIASSSPISAKSCGLPACRFSVMRSSRDATRIGVSPTSAS